MPHAHDGTGNASALVKPMPVSPKNAGGPKNGGPVNSRPKPKSGKRVQEETERRDAAHYSPSGSPRNGGAGSRTSSIPWTANGCAWRPSSRNVYEEQERQHIAERERAEEELRTQQREAEHRRAARRGRSSPPEERRGCAQIRRGGPRSPSRKAVVRRRQRRSTPTSSRRNSILQVPASRRR